MPETCSFSSLRLKPAGRGLVGCCSRQAWVMVPSIQSGAQGQRLAFLALASSADGFDAERAYHKMAAGCLDQVWVMLMSSWSQVFCGLVFCQCAEDVSELSGSHQSWLSLVQQFDVHRHGTLIGKHSCKGIHAVLLRLTVGSSSVNVIQVRLSRADLKAASTLSQPAGTSLC